MKTKTTHEATINLYSSESFLCFVISQAHDIKNKKMKKNIVLI